MDWNRVYNEARIAEFGFAREVFLARPLAVLRACGQESAPEAIASGCKPLLPAQAMVAKKLARQWNLTEPRSDVVVDAPVLNEYAPLLAGVA